MEYIAYFNDEKIELKPYNFEIEDKIKAAGTEPKKRYDFLCDVVGRSQIVNILGEFRKCDPNELGMLFEEIVTEYKKPLINKNIETIGEQLEKFQFDKLEKLADIVDKINA